jgi:hypothetical protein
MCIAALLVQACSLVRSGRAEGVDPLSALVIERRVHAGPAAHAAGVVEGDVFELDW